MTDTGEFVLTMVIGYIVATILAVIGAVVTGMTAIWITDDLGIGMIVGFITAIVIFVVISIVTFQLARDPKEMIDKCKKCGNKQR